MKYLIKPTIIFLAFFIIFQSNSFAANKILPLPKPLPTKEVKSEVEKKKDEIILDIGPITIKKIEEIIDKSSTVLWNGPAGYFENNNFAKGTYSIAKKISENTSSKSLISIIGGGDTISAINKIEIKLTFTHLSTAGGAFLEFLEGKDLPGLGVLK